MRCARSLRVTLERRRVALRTLLSSWQYQLRRDALAYTLNDERRVALADGCWDLLVAYETWTHDADATCLERLARGAWQIVENYRLALCISDPAAMTGEYGEARLRRGTCRNGLPWCQCNGGAS